MRTKGSFRSTKRSGGGRPFRGFLRPIRRIQQQEMPASRPLPTYQQHSAGSPEVKGAPRRSEGVDAMKALVPGIPFRLIKDCPKRFDGWHPPVGGANIRAWQLR
jgi:hypothetical protein